MADPVTNIRETSSGLLADCPKCGKSFRFASDQFGSVSDCPYCKKSCIIPKQDGSIPTEAEIGYKAIESLGKLMIEEEEEKKKKKKKEKTSGTCFIATAVYGSYDAPEVHTLRAFRDNVLSSNPIGRFVASLYNRIAPAVAAFLREHPIIKGQIRRGLDAIVRHLWSNLKCENQSGKENC